MVFYRKYRPQSLSELVGQEQVKKLLLGAFETNKLSHAYLFCGPKGTGKTSTARILAKMVNCTARNSSLVNSIKDENEKRVASNDQIIPCNKCNNCLTITDGSNLDLIEIDAASNRGIDDIREIREKIKLAPTSSRKKVYIIDEVHMLSNEAFNALLKTLEEPPEHVLFILATTDPHKIPETILSRVIKVEFKLALNKDVLIALEKVVEGENLKVEAGVLDLLAKKSGGSFRDGIKLLDQLASSGEQISISLINEQLKNTNFESQVKILEQIAINNSSEALKLSLEQIELGVNIKEFILSLMDLTRSLMLIKYGIADLVKDQYGSDKFAQLFEISAKIDLVKIKLIFNNLQFALEKNKFSSNSSFPLELAIIESATEEKMDSDIKVETQLTTQPKIVVDVSQSKSVVLDNQEVLAREEAIVIDRNPNASEDLNILKDKWTYILETIKPYNFSLEALLKLVKILDCGESEVILEVPYSFHQRILEAPKSKDLLESVLGDVLGRKIKVTTILGKKPIRTEEVANIEVAADDEIIRIAAEIFNSDQVN